MKSSLLACFAFGVVLTNSSTEGWAKCPNPRPTSVQELINTMPQGEWPKHFEQNAKYLRDRIASSQDTIRTASSFKDRATLESAIQQAYSGNQPAIQNWWASATPGDRGVFDQGGTFSGLVVICPVGVTCTEETAADKYKYVNEIKNVRIVFLYLSDDKKCVLLTMYGS
jgi:Bacterial CdiA-CT RNAse A domain